MTSRPAWWLALGALLVGLGFGWLVMNQYAPSSDPGNVPDAVATESVASLVGEPLPSLADVAAWERRPDSLAGHVVVVAFVSLNLPSSLAVLHDLEAWHDAYARYGLRIVCVQVPEFAYAAEPPSFHAAVRRLAIAFPIGLDPSLAAWRAFGARGDRPRLLVADPNGRVTLDSAGVTAAPAAEREIRALLMASRPDLRFPAAAPRPVAISSGHPPVHLGRARVSDGPLATTPPGEPTTFTAQLRYQVEGKLYTPYPVGRWVLSADGLTTARPGAENFVALRYDAGALGAVMAPPAEGPTRVWVLRDERWLEPEELGADARVDGRGASYVWVDEARYYSIARESPGSHVVKLSPEAAGATLHAVTFEPAGPDLAVRP